MNFEKYAAQGNRLLKEVAEELGAPLDRDRAGRVMIAVLHALRSRLSAEQSLHFIAQLPLVIKGLYVDGWRLSTVPDKGIRTVDDFLDEVYDQAGVSGRRDFDDPLESAEVVQRTLRVLKRHISAGEVSDIAAELPKSLQGFWEAA